MSELKVEGLTKDWCTTCAHCTGKKRLDGHTYYICEDPYDAVMTEHDAEEEILCNMFKVKGDVKMELKDYTECPLYKKMIEGCVSSSDSNDIYFTSTQVYAMIQSITEQKGIEKNHTINQLKIENKQLECKIKDLTDTNNKLMERNVELVAQCDETYEKFRDCERVLHDILNEVYEHPEMFERNMTAYEFLPGRVRFLNDSWNIMCDKYDPLNVENEQRKKAMDNQYKMIQDLKKERDELAEKLKNTDISKVPKLEAQIKNLKYLNEESYKREEELEKEVKRLKECNEGLGKANDRLSELVNKVSHERNELIKTSKRKDELIQDYREKLKKANDLVENLKCDNLTLQNEILRIRNIAQKAYDDTNRD